jgi:hypothetical protein
MTDYLKILRQALERRPGANGHADLSTVGRRHTLRELGKLYGVKCGHGYVGGVGCFLCDPNHEYRLGRGDKA